MLMSNFFFLKKKLMTIKASDLRLDQNRTKKVFFNSIITKNTKKP